MLEGFFFSTEHFDYATKRLLHWLDTYSLILTLLRPILGLSLHRDSSSSTSAVFPEVIEELPSVSSSLVECLVSPISLATRECLSLSLSSESIAVRFNASVHILVVLLIWLLPLLLLVNTLARAIHSLLVSVIGVVLSTTASSSWQGSSVANSTQLLVPLDQVFQATLHLHVCHLNFL